MTTLLAVDLNPFKPQFGLYVWVTLAFLIVLYVLASKVFPRLEETLAERERRIKGNLEAAEATKAEAERLLAEYRAQVSSIREEAARITEEARAAGEALRKELMTKAEAEAREVVTKAQEQLNSERDRVIGELQRQLAAWSAEIAGKIVQREINPETHRDLVEAFIRDIQGKETTHS
ncbi:MAG TPA: F0F1 ATP synthase subunit B [Actinomycetota bacterium]|jgi:F-type H+-transporting ATPase subunit b